MSKSIFKVAPLVLGAMALAGCPGDDVSIDTDASSSDTGTTTEVTPTSDPTLTATTTTDPDPDSTGPGDSSSSDGGAVCEPACGAGECCVEGFCFGEPDPSCEGCTDDEVCEMVPGSDPCDGEGMCVPTACGVDGNYDPCFDVQCPAGYICLVDNVANPSVSWCALEGCGDECDCPTPPEGATASCSDITGGGTNHCALSCTGGNVCPDDMICFAGQFCVWPAETGGEPIYGDCINDGLQCNVADGLTCLSDMANTFGWCSVTNCADAADCEPAPATGDAPPACLPLLQGGGTACALDCAAGQTCPDGMSCLNDQFCVWTPAVDGYLNCGLPGVDCPMGEVCLDDMPMGMMDPAWSVCSQPACTDVADCTFTPPATGTAPVACADPTGMGGANTCYLDCSMGDTCPDGMACIDNSWCAWPGGAITFQDDFESGSFMMGGWTLADVDMNMPAMQTAFVTDAWVVTDMVDGGNFAAVSTSWYMPMGMSDDWLISPQIMLGANTRVYWDARSSDPGFPDGYELRISTGMPDPADFMANMELLSVAAEDPAYTGHFIDLAPAGYMNVPVYLAWRNVTNDGNLLLLDNVVVIDQP